MIFDSGFISALKLPTQVIIGLFLASLILLGLDWLAIFPLATFGDLTRAIVFVLSIVFGSLAFTAIGAFVKDQWMQRRKHSFVALRRQLRTEEIKREREATCVATLERIDYLSSNEVTILADCLREGSQSFFTYVHSPPVTTLISKGLVYTPGGTHHQDHYPFTIHDFVWKALMERKEQILEKDAQNRKAEARGRR